MMKVSQVEFAGYECVKLENAVLSLHVTVLVGPRILGCAAHGGRNLFAVLGEDEPFVYPGGGHYYVRGGHRLWYAPESASFTYVPDNAPVAWQENTDGISLRQEVDAPTGIQKEMQIVLDPDAAKVTLHHSLTNMGDEGVELAPWSISQMQPGGAAILPQNTRLTDEEGFWANRALVLWPYAQMHDPHITWGDRYIFVQASYKEGRFKVGWPNLNGWMAYALEDTLFVKSAEYSSDQDYYDAQASSQCYCNPYFLELETLGPITVLEPGETVHHEERWQVFGGIDFEANEDKMAELAVKLGLEDDI